MKTKLSNALLIAVGLMPIWMVPICLIAHKFHIVWLINTTETLIVIWAWLIVVSIIYGLDFIANPPSSGETKCLR